MTGYFVQAFIYLLSAVVAVPLARRFGLGSVLGYLFAGFIIGPVTGLVGDETSTIQHFAEFGVVMMLFLVGLELEPKMLWQMRHRLVGLGGLQVGITVVLCFLIGLFLELDWRAAITVGLILSLSSTAITLQTFNEKGLTKTEGGRGSFSVLLFQDIAVIPMLALIPLLALPELAADSGAMASASSHADDFDFVTQLPGWAYTIVVILAIGSVIFSGHYLCHPLFKIVANTGLREIFTATTLMLVIGIAALMNLVGLSPALGTFLAGVVLANSEFRHELEADLEPFKGLLLGLFFITVGAGLDLGVILPNLPLILSLAFGVMALKAMVLWVLAWFFKLKSSDGWLFALSLAQAGEFGFVLLGFSTQHYALPAELAEILSPVIAFSMFLTPALFIVFDKVILKLYEPSKKTQSPDDIDEQGAVLIAGIGRFGQITNRLLVANGIKTVVLDHSVNMIHNLKKINVKSYFGDATRPGLLHTAGIEQASLFIVAIDDRARTTNLVAHVRENHPHVKILARAYDRAHSYELEKAGAHFVVAETYYSALELGARALGELGFQPLRVEHLKHMFINTEKQRHEELFKTWQSSEEENKFGTNYIELFLQMEKALSSAMLKENTDDESRNEREWMPPPKEL